MLKLGLKFGVEEENPGDKRGQEEPGMARFGLLFGEVEE